MPRGSKKQFNGRHFSLLCEMSAINYPFSKQSCSGMTVCHQVGLNMRKPFTLWNSKYLFGDIKQKEDEEDSPTMNEFSEFAVRKERILYPNFACRKSMKNLWHSRGTATIYGHLKQLWLYYKYSLSKFEKHILHSFWYLCKATSHRVQSLRAIKKQFHICLKIHTLVHYLKHGTQSYRNMLVG